MSIYSLKEIKGVHINALCISAIASNQGKTILTTALLYHFKKSVRPFKIGPDFIDPQFHEKVCGTPSINLDTCIMNEVQVQWMFAHYSNKEYAILEGVMGFYDGMDKGSSAYDVSKLLKVPTVLVLDASGSYITLSAVLKGLKEYRSDCTIKGVIFNHVGSQGHFELIKNRIEEEFNDIVVLGWIKKGLETLQSTHLGLDLKESEKEKLEKLSQEVLKHIDLGALERMSQIKKLNIQEYPFQAIEKNKQHLAVVHDQNFSFLYHDNLEFLKEQFETVTLVNGINNEEVPKDCDVLYIPGGYIETNEAYERIKDAYEFKTSIVEHAKKNKPIYAECAGLLFISKCVDEKGMLGLLDIEFTLSNRFVRMGYYENDLGITGHAFHYTKPKNENMQGEYSLYKGNKALGKVAAFQKRNVFGTYLHTMFRNNFTKIQDKFGF